MKQTAVEFLIEEIKPFLSMPIEDAYKTILQAKAMEKEQMTSFAKLWESKIFDGSIDSIDDYFNKTYGGNK